MSTDWKDRIAGIKRIVLAFGVMSLCILTSLEYQSKAEPEDPGMIQTANAKYAKCSAAVRETKLGMFGCAIVLKPKVKTSSIRFLSAESSSDDARTRTRPMFAKP